MAIKKMEKIKLCSDIGVTIFGLLAAFCAVSSLYYGSKLDYTKKLEEEKLKSKVAESNAFAEKAKEQAAKALLSAANTNEKAKNIELKVEKQKERAANAEKELIILKNKIKPRSIPIESANEVALELKKNSYKKISISSSLGDGEALSYANQFKSVFEFSGWEVKSSGIGLSTFTGVGVYIITKTENDKEALKMKKIFASSGIKLQEHVMPEFPEMMIFIGSKDNKILDSNKEKTIN